MFCKYNEPKYFSFIVAASFICGGNQRKPSTFRSHKINGIDSKRLGKKYIIIRDSRDIAFLSLNYWFSLERTLEIQCSGLRQAQKCSHA